MTHVDIYLHIQKNRQKHMKLFKTANMRTLEVKELKSLKLFCLNFIFSIGIFMFFIIILFDFTQQHMFYCSVTDLQACYFGLIGFVLLFRFNQVYLSFSLYIIYLSVILCISVFLHLSFCPYLSNYQSVYIYLSKYLSISLSIYI